MKLLFDQNLSFRLCQRLADIFPDSQQVRLISLDTAFAQNNDFTLVTLDADFADLATLRGAPPKVIWLRCGNQPVRAVENILRSNHSQIEVFATDEEAACLELY